MHKKEIDSLKLIIYKLIREKPINNKEVEIIEEIIEKKDYSG